MLWVKQVMLSTYLSGQIDKLLRQGPEYSKLNTLLLLLLASVKSGWKIMYPLFLLDIFFICISNVIPFSGFLSPKPPIPSHFPASMKAFPHPLTLCLSALAFPYTGTSSLHRTKGLSSHWWPTRPFSATYSAGAMSPTMCTLWFVA